ncbi:MAG: lactate racemase domain-containing protein [Planctomycetota bacterium]|nr:lactate racemase domain-containing protein [Planctomycetota bacterium]
MGSNNSKLIEEADGKKRYLVHYGEGFRYERMPRGTRVIYPPPPLEPIADRRSAIEQAIDHPLESDPLDARLKRGMKVTIAFDDLSLPLPPMVLPDIRQTMIEVLLERLDRAGVEDIHLMAATGLHRFMRPGELRRVMGKAIFDRFWPDRLYNYDAEDPDGNVDLGKTDEGEDVEVSRRAVDSDLLLYVNINLTSMDGGPKSLTTGISTYRSIRHHHVPHALLGAKSLMDPSNSKFHDSLGRIHKRIMEHIKLFTIETTLNTDSFPGWLGYLQKSESKFSTWDRLNFLVNRHSLPILPYALRRKIFLSICSPYGLTGVTAGKSEPVHKKTLEAIHKQQVVQVDGQTDVLLMGIPYLGPYDLASDMNPLLVWCLGLGYIFNMYIGKPLVREGGVVILYHPLENRFDPVHHPSYIDFYEKILPETREPEEIHRRYEKEYATNPRYIDLYRNHYAYHGVHPFYMWTWGVSAMKHLSKVIAVAPKDAAVAERLGMEVAASLDEALEMASGATGPNPSMSYFHFPPIFLAHVS